MKIFALLLLLLAPTLRAWCATSNIVDAAQFTQTDHAADDTEALARAIDECRRHPDATLRLEHKVYHLYPRQFNRREWYISNTSSAEECPDKVKSVGLLLENIKGLTIEGNGATLMIHGKMISIAAVNSENIAIRNLTVDYASPTMSEMTIESTTNGSTLVKFNIPDYVVGPDSLLTLTGEGWTTKRHHAVVYDPATEHLAYSGLWDTFSRVKAKDMGNNKVMLHTEVPPQAVGQVLTVRDHIRDQVGMFISGCDNIELKDLKVRFMHGLGIVTQRSRNIAAIGVECAPPPGSGRLMASTADFMHFSGCAGKITIKDCYFSGAHDDCVNIHGTFLRIVKTSGKRKATLRFMHPQSYGFTAFEAGDTVAVVDGNTLRRQQRLVVKKVKTLNPHELELEFTTPMPADMLDKCVENLTWTPRVEITGCTFTHTNTRGTLVSTPRKVVIDSNLYLKTGMSAILVESDASSWYESGPVNDVTITRNRFLDCAYLGGPHHAVVAFNPSTAGTEPVHDNITISHNVFGTYGNPVLYARNTSRLDMTRNIIAAIYPDTDQVATSGQAMLLDNCQQVDTTANTLFGYSEPTAVTPSKTIWFDAPAQIWEETLPLGNGRMGLMPDGGIERERIVLNEISMWSGSEFDYSNPEAAKSLPEIRRLLLEGKNALAQKMMYEHFVPKKPENGGTYGTYQILANLDIDYRYPAPANDVESYSRVLDLASGVAQTTFTLGDSITFERLYAASRTADVVLMRLSGSKPGSVGFTLGLNRPERGLLSQPHPSCLMIEGELDSGQPGVDGVRYAVSAGVKATGSNARVTMAADSLLTVDNADEVWIVVSAATSFFFGHNYADTALVKLEEALASPQQALASGVLAHAGLMDRAEIELPAGVNSLLPTPARLDRFEHDTSDLALAALYYNYGRYLLIASTRPGLLPPNLQGLWANTTQTPWNGDYHTNINVQMNHWPAEPGNLSELTEPLTSLVLRAVPSGTRTAKAFYGPDAQGWVMHMMTNVWNYTEPGEHPSWGATNTGGAWLARHLWDHWLYTGDTAYLSEVYPAMRESARFFLSTMIREPKHGWLVTAPSSSPENTFFDPDSVEVSICMGPAMDSQIVGELWSNVVEAAAILGLQDSFTDSLQVALAFLPPVMTDSTGRIMEWLEPYPEVDIHHRHVSHLYALHPGTSISPAKTPQLAAAAAKTLDVRGDEGTGWSRAWKMNFHARLHNGDRAWSIFHGLMQPAYLGPDKHRRAGTFPNLFCSHDPFQIDGNFGGAAAIGEFLVQSSSEAIDLLPALPSAWTHGRLHGFKTIGGALIDLEWTEGTPSRVVVTGGYRPDITLRFPDGTQRQLHLAPGEQAELTF